jgi:FtsZ-binding cell division protein ZapB
MSPFTTEENLELSLQYAKEDLKLIQLEISSLKENLSKAETVLVSYHLEVDKLSEELRRFRLMYPGFCKNKE